MNSFRIKKIRQSNLGVKLKECREEKELRLEDIYQTCNIPVKYLQALEEERWSDLPGEIYLKNFLEKYCSVLGLNFKLCFKQYNKQIVLKEKHFQKKKPKQNFSSLLDFLNPKRFKVIMIIIILIIFLGYLYFKINNYISPPDLIINYPPENFETMENIVTISGQTEIEAMVFVNSESVSVEEDGQFHTDLKLKYGLNRFYLTSQRKYGRHNNQEVIILKKQNIENSVLEEN